MFSAPLGTPGISAGYAAHPREVFAANRSFAQFVAGPVTIDGHASGNPLNAPYTGLLFAGTLMGRLATTGKYANGVIGVTTAAYAHAGGTPTQVMVPPAVAAEIARRIGPAGIVKVTGPATAGGTVATAAVAYTAANVTTGVVTLTAAAAVDFVAGSLVQPTDGSEALVTVLCDAWGVTVADPLGDPAARQDALGGLLLAAGGTVDVTQVVNYPADSSLRAWVKAAIRTTCPGVNFSDDFA